MSSITLWLSIATAVIAILSAIFSQIEKNQEKAVALAKEKELNQKNNEIIQSQKMLLTLQKDSKDSQEKYSNQIIALQSELYEKQVALQNKTNEVIAMQQESINQYNGGASFCIVDLHIGKTADGNFEQYVFVKNMGNYPLRGVIISIDVPLWSTKKSNSPLLANSPPGHFFVYGPIDIPAQANILLGKNEIDASLMEPKMTYAASIQIPKGFYQQFIRLALIKNLQYRYATKIMNNNLGIKYEFVDPLYPKKPDGNVDWIIIDE